MANTTLSGLCMIWHNAILHRLFIVFTYFIRVLFRMRFEIAFENVCRQFVRIYIADGGDLFDSMN